MIAKQRGKRVEGHSLMCLNGKRHLLGPLLMIAIFAQNWPFCPVFPSITVQKTTYPTIEVPHHTDHQNPRKCILINAVCISRIQISLGITYKASIEICEHFVEKKVYWSSFNSKLTQTVPKMSTNYSKKLSGVGLKISPGPPVPPRAASRSPAIEVVSKPIRGDQFRVELGWKNHSEPCYR